MFQPLLSTLFRVRRGPVWIDARLHEVTPSQAHRPGVNECFSLLFRAGPELPLSQGTHAFEHPALGPFELFITPVHSRTPGSLDYEAVINRQ
jgi:hypothetical protein